MKLKNEANMINYDVICKYANPEANPKDEYIYSEEEIEEFINHFKNLCKEDRFSELTIKKIKPNIEDYYTIDAFTDIQGIIDYYINKPKFDKLYKTDNIEGIPSYICLDFYILNESEHSLSIYLAEYTEGYQYFSIKVVKDESNHPDGAIYTEPVLTLKLKNKELRSLIEKFRVNPSYITNKEKQRVLNNLIDEIYRSMIEKIINFVKML